jgi:hypothetical protein
LACVDLSLGSLIFEDLLELLLVLMPEFAELIARVTLLDFEFVRERFSGVLEA